MPELKMALFDNCNTEEFYFLCQIFEMMLDAPGMLAANAKLQYMHTIILGEALR